MPFSYKGPIACVLLSMAGLVHAEPAYSIKSSQLVGTTLYAQSLNETGLVTVKPKLSADSIGDVEVLDQCLWSIKVILDNGDVSYSPGKMVCIGPQQEVLESVPVGSVTPVGRCMTDGCERYTVDAKTAVTMKLTKPLEFNVQARNER